MYRESGGTITDKSRRTILGAISSLVLAASALLWPITSASAAGTAQLYLSPASPSVTTGQNVTLSIRVDSGSEEATAIEVNGAYNQNELKFVGIDGSGSAFDFEIEESGGNGSFNVTRLAFSDNVTGDALVARITFKTLNDGSSTVKLTNESELSDPDGQLFTLQRSGATVNASTQSSGGSGGSSGGSGGSGGSSGGSGSGSSGGSGGSGGSSGGSGGSGTDSGPTSNRTGLSLSVQSDYIGYTLASLSIQTSRKATTTVSYGSSADELEFTTKPSKSSTTHGIVLDSRAILPGNTYYYQVTARSGNGTSAKSDILTFETTGVPLSVQVFNKDGDPVPGITVSVKENDTIRATTNEDGLAIFDSFPGGDVTVVLSSGFWQSTEHTISNNDFDITTQKIDGPSKFSQTAGQSNATVQLDYNPVVIGWGSVLKGIGLLLGLAIVIIIILRLINMLRTRVNYARTLESQQSPTVVGPQPPASPPQAPSAAPPQPPPPPPQSASPPPTPGQSPGPGQVVQPNQDQTDNPYNQS